MARRERDDDCFSAPFTNFPSADDRLDRVVAALRNNVWLESFYKLEWSVLRKKHDAIDCFESSEHICALGFIANRSIITLETLYRGIGVEAYDERVALCSRRVENIDVTGVNEIEDTISENDATADRLSPGGCLFPRFDFFCGRARGQNFLSADGWRWNVLLYFSWGILYSRS